MNIHGCAHLVQLPSIFVVDVNDQPFTRDEWTLIAPGKLGCPQQNNYDDCGVYVLALMMWLLNEHEPDYTPDDIGVLRHRLAAAILDGKMQFT